MDPIDYAFSQSMSVFTTALRWLPMVLGIAFRIFVCLLPFALAVVAAAIATVVGFGWGFISVIVAGIQYHGNGAIDVENFAKQRVLDSPTFRRFFGIRGVAETRYPGDDQYPRGRFDLMSVTIPGQWMRFAFSLYPKCANGALDVGLLLGALMMPMINPLVGSIKKWKMNHRR